MIKFLVIDVDGTMTDSGIYYDNYGNELKKFSTRDAAGIFAAQYVGIKIIILTGRMCVATEKRMKELKVDYLFQNVTDKYEFLLDFMRKKQINKHDLGYIGDDLNDLKSMQLAEFVGCPSDSCKEIKEQADYVSSVMGGYGAVREVIEHYLRDKGCWREYIYENYDIDT